METGGAPVQAAWKSVVRMLCDHLAENDDRISYLRSIDQMMVDDSLAIEDLVSVALEKLPPLSHATDAHLYLDSGQELCLLCSSASHRMPERLETSVISSALPSDDAESKAVDRSAVAEGKSLFPESQNLFLIPMWLGGSEQRIWPAENRRFGVVILEARYPQGASPFHDPAVRGFVQTVVGQLAIAINTRLEHDHANWLLDLHAAFNKHRLEPSPCFKELAQRVPSFLPSFGPFRLGRSPGTQVLLYWPQVSVLTIEGTTSGRAGDRLKVEKSVVGLLFEPPGREFVLGDPTRDAELRERYKAYLGKDGKDRETIRTELAARIRGPDGRYIGALNLESELEHAFKTAHIDALLALCSRLTGVTAALRAIAIDAAREQQAITYAQQSYWNTVGALLRHNTRGQLVAIQLSLGNAQTVADAHQLEGLEEALAPAHSAIHALTDGIRLFSEELYQYTVYGKYSIRSIISDVIAMFQRRLHDSAVQIELTKGEDFEVFCSGTLSMHIYNIIDNSMYWVNQRTMQEPDHPGRIQITVEPGPLPEEDQERELNRTCKVVIQDNGPGCPEETLSRLCHQPVTSRRTKEEGMGHALYAIHTYLRSISGSIEPESVEGEFFRVTLTLSVFDERIHRARGMDEI